MNSMRWTSRRLARLEAQAARTRAVDDTSEQRRLWALVFSDQQAHHLACECLDIITRACKRDPTLEVHRHDTAELLRRLDDDSLRALRDKRIELDERLAWVKANKQGVRGSRSSA